MGKFGLHHQHTRRQGFTLVEMLAVMGIMLTMLAMVVPAINDVLNSKGRKGAVNILLNTFEQARIAALEQSTNVYVGFADQNMPDSAVGGRNEGFPYTRFIVFRDRIEDIDGATAPRFIPLTKWLALPKGISFKSGKATIADVGSGGTVILANTDNFPSVKAAYTMPVVKFNSTGTIDSPSDTTKPIWLFIYEGYYASGVDVFTRARGGRDTDSALFERISFARYTGRAQLDITTLPTS